MVPGRFPQEADFGLAPDERFEPSDAPVEPIDVMQPHIMTVLGPVSPEDLGLCLHHEHLLCDPVAVTAEEPDYRLDDRHAALDELEAWFLGGGRAIVDASTRDYGRDVAGLHWLAERAPVHVIMVTGRHKALHSERLSVDQPIVDLRDEMLAEIRTGVGETEVRPGVIKFGTSLNEIRPVEERAARAAAQAHLSSGLTITTHTEAGTMGMEQLDLLEREGVASSRVILGHLDRRLDEGYLTAVLDRGAWVSFDQIGKANYGPDEPKAAMLARLSAAGHGDKLLLSQDLGRKSLIAAYGGSPGWLYMPQRFALMMMAAGFSGEQVKRLLVDNPARALSIVMPH